MKLEVKKILKISIILLAVIGAFLYVYISVTSFNKNDIQTKGLILLSETSDIRSILSKYHLMYGEYPKTESNVFLNNRYLCDYKFYNNNSSCSDKNVFIFKKYTNNFIYEKNLDGTDYSIKFVTQYDNKELGCVNDKKTKKKGCTFKLNTSGISVEK